MAYEYRYSDEDMNLKALMARFWELVESDSVRPFVWLYYVPLLMWGVYAVSAAEPISFLAPFLGHFFYTVWTWIPIPGTLSAMIGLTLRHGGSAYDDMTTRLLFRDWLGLWLQAGAHACMCLVLLVFEIGTFGGAHWGQPVLSAFALSSYVIGTFLLCLQCCRKLWRGWQLEKQ